MLCTRRNPLLKAYGSFSRHWGLMFEEEEEEEEKEEDGPTVKCALSMK
jgi:hypothetical protein